MLSRSISRGSACELGQLVGGLGCLGRQRDVPRSDLFFDDRRFRDEIVADEGDMVLRMRGRM